VSGTCPGLGVTVPNKTWKRRRGTDRRTRCPRHDDRRIVSQTQRRLERTRFSNRTHFRGVYSVILVQSLASISTTIRVNLFRGKKTAERLRIRVTMAIPLR